MKARFFMLLHVLMSFVMLASCSINEIERPDDDQPEWSNAFSEEPIQRHPAAKKIQNRKRFLQGVMERD